MKMAKPSARDIEAAEELHQVLQLIDARFGGPFQNHEAGNDLAELLDNGDNAFDSDNLQHLQTLYNHLARLLRTAPNFYGRVIGGMVWVIMNEANQILDPESDCIDLHPRFQQMATEGERLRQSMLRLVTMHCAAATKNNATDAELEQYLSAGIAQLEAERDALAAAPAQDVTGLVEAISPALHWAGSFRDAWPEDSEYPDGAWVVGAVSDGEQYPIITVNADQYDAPGDSEKIARAIIALLAAALAAHDKQSGGAA